MLGNNVLFLIQIVDIGGYHLCNLLRKVKAIKKRVCLTSLSNPITRSQENLCSHHYALSLLLVLMPLVEQPCLWQVPRGNTVVRWDWIGATDSVTDKVSALLFQYSQDNEATEQVIIIETVKNLGTVEELVRGQG